MRQRAITKAVAVGVLAFLLPAGAWAQSAPQENRRQGPPPAATAACEGKNAGDAVQFTNRRGETVPATCRDMDGRLVAVPDNPGWSGKRGGGGSHGERHLARLTKALELTETQQAQVRAILAAEREKTAPLREKMRESRGRLQAAIHSGTADEAAIRALAADQAALKADLLVARAQGWKEIHALLTPEQQELAKKSGPFGFGAGKKGRCAPR